MAGKMKPVVLNTTKMKMARTPPGVRDGREETTRQKKPNQKRDTESHQRETTLLISEDTRLSELMDKETLLLVLRTTTPRLAVTESSC
jgi:hypothetical protein